MSISISQPVIPGISRLPIAQRYEFSLEIEREAGAIEAWAPMLDELAKEAIVSNIFYEPWMLLPALESYAAQEDMVFVMVLATAEQDGGRFLCGFFPLAARAMYRGLPMHNLAMWRYPHCYLGTPLLHRCFVGESLQVLTNWFQSEKQYRLMVFNDLSAQDGFHGEFEVVLASAPVRTVVQAHDRAFFTASQNADAGPASALSLKATREYRRLQRQLSEQGELRWSELCMDDCAEDWIDEFLCLEASGWKGRSGTALRSSEEGRAFFSRIAAEAFKRGRLLILSLRLDDRAIAMIAVLRCGEGGYAFKMAHDETFRHFAPGILLLIELNRRLQVRAGFSWLDSCANSGNALANRLWTDRRPLCNVIVAKRYSLAGCILRCWPMLALFKKQLVRIGRGIG